MYPAELPNHHESLAEKAEVETRLHELAEQCVKTRYELAIAELSPFAAIVTDEHNGREIRAVVGLQYTKDMVELHVGYLTADLSEVTRSRSFALTTDGSEMEPSNRTDNRTMPVADIDEAKFLVSDLWERRDLNPSRTVTVIKESDLEVLFNPPHPGRLERFKQRASGFAKRKNLWRDEEADRMRFQQ